MPKRKEKDMAKRKKNLSVNELKRRNKQSLISRGVTTLIHPDGNIEALPVKGGYVLRTGPKYDHTRRRSDEIAGT